MTTREECERRVGERVRGKWTLDAMIGYGGMAAVYAARHHIGRRDAIKILHPEYVRDPEIRARFELEGRATNRFRHPGVVEVRDADVTEDGCPFLVMELLEGESLGDRARRLGDIPIHDTLRWSAEVLEVLDAAHREGVVHRDIKLENVFITAEGRARVLDFGVARQQGSSFQTQLGARLGTTSYMAPEQVRGGQIDGRADIFALGVVMFRLLTKQKIHEAPSESELVVRMATEPAPKTRSVNPAVPEDVALVVDRALAYDACDRYPDARAMLSDVAALRSGGRPAFALSRAMGGAGAAVASARTIGPGGPASSGVTMGVGTPSSVATIPPVRMVPGTAPVSAQTPVSSDARPADSTRVAPASYAAFVADVSAPASSGLAEASAPPRNKMMVFALIGSAVLVGIMVIVLVAISRDDTDPVAGSASAPAASPPPVASSGPRSPATTRPRSDEDDFLRRVREIEKAKQR